MNILSTVPGLLISLTAALNKGNNKITELRISVVYTTIILNLRFVLKLNLFITQQLTSDIYFHV